MKRFILKKVDEAEGDVIKTFKFQGKDVEIRKGSSQGEYRIVPNIFKDVVRNTWSVVFSSRGQAAIYVNFVYDGNYFGLSSMTDDVKEMNKVFNQIDKQIGRGVEWTLSKYIVLGLPEAKVAKG